MSPEPSRSYDSSDCTIVSETMPSGDFLVRMHHGAVAMRMTVPASHIPFLFPSPIGSRPGAAGEVAFSAPASPHVFQPSPCLPAVPGQGEPGAAEPIHGDGGAGDISAVVSSPVAGAEAGERPSRVALPGESRTHVVRTETGWVRATQLADGGWYLSMKDGANVGCTFLTATALRTLFSQEFDQ